MKKLLFFLFVIVAIVVFAFQFQPVKQTVVAVVTKPTYLNKSGKNIKERVKIPEGFTRVPYDSSSFQHYIRHQNLKKFGTKVINYDGEPYFYQLGHVGVLDVDVPSNGLQQCADALIRLRSEYLWKTNQKGKIGFKFTSGHYCSWQKYAEGYRPKINGNKVTFHKTAQSDNSKANFYKYLNLIYTYSGTMSLNNELKEIKSIKDLKIGDMLIVGGFPGHVIMIADITQNENDERMFLLIQGNTPAQSIHLLKNLDDSAISPWYKLQLNSEISVPGFTFTNSKFVRFKDE
ncbi:DUF4846 domain-containing protein [uncultured Winogradskyella sp.]|uniref:DUF4846 domain-containing protein n=1 Tax=uncultured Winogradskyella sp. TaxID=395353 RepID=UPI00260758B5|nr:DUF4846 domain-containing protein [uncultured Winogradskyella sp.]